jgi:hypothetical protein
MKNFRNYFLLAMLVGMGALLSSCVVRGGAAFRTSPGYEPQLVEVSPGVWVVENYHEPIFYDNGYYWRYDNNVWYRSRYHSNGWVHVGHHQVPRAVVRIDRPGRYARYRATGNARVRRANHTVPAQRGNTYDHRRAAPRNNRRAAPARGPAVRDNRRPAPAVRDHRRQKPVKQKKSRDPRSRDHRRP